MPRNVVLLGLTSLFNDLSSEMIFSIFPAFFVSVLKAGAGSLGLVDGVAEATSNVFKAYSGALSDRIGHRKGLVIVGYALSLATRPLYALATTVLPVLSLRVIDRVGKGVRDAPRDALISLSTEQGETGKSFGFHRAMDTLGGILGPFAAYLLLMAFPLRFDLVFLLAFVLGLPAIMTLLFVSDIVTPKERRAPFAPAWRELPSRFKSFLAAVGLLSLGTLPVTVLLLKAGTLGLTLGSVPLFYVLHNVSYAAFSTTAGKLSDRVGTRTVLAAGYLVPICAYAALATANSAWSLGLAFLLLGLFPALTDGVQRSAASQLTEPHQRGASLGLVNATNGIGALLAGAVGGLLWQNYSPAVALSAAAVVLVAGLVLFLHVTRKPTSV